jgi:hypothetical protein
MIFAHMQQVILIKLVALKLQGGVELDKEGNPVLDKR